jgi:aminoglycoside phosphotransferase family enzyme/predicted kinase
MKSVSTQTALIDWLQVADHYPHSVNQLQLVQTHISCVFLTGDYAYKLKKAVCFEFLDFSKLEQRRHFCQLEIELNRRTAANLYLEVVSVYYHNETGAFSLNPRCAEQPQWQVVDYLVKMRQFDPKQLLSRLILRESLNSQAVTELAQRIADFHRQAEIIYPPAFWGSAECVLAPMLANFPSLARLFQRLIDQQQLDQSALTRLQFLAQHTHAQHTLLAPLLSQRQQQGFVRACHGDLHLDNITYYQGKLVLFDGIEFNDQFRLIDVMSDLAFLLTDLDANHCRLTSQQLLNRYLIDSGDYQGLGIINFYQTYRAMVRAKISGLRYEQMDPTSAEASKLLAQTFNYLALAESYAFPAQQAPKLLIMQGISGSGKSFLANELANLTGALWINSDRERKRWFGIAATERVSGSAHQKLYSNAANQATYQGLYEACSAGLQAGRDVIVDATFLAKASRQAFFSLAARHQADCATLALIPNPALAGKRITERLAKQQDPSDATIAVMQRQIAHFEAPAADEPAFVFNDPDPICSTRWSQLLAWFRRERELSLLE